MKRNLFQLCLAAVAAVCLPISAYAVGFHAGGIAGGFHPGGMGGGFHAPGPIGGTGLNLAHGANFGGSAIGGLGGGISAGDFGGGNFGGGGVHLPNGGVNLPSNDFRGQFGGASFPNILPNGNDYTGFTGDHASMPAISPHYPNHTGPSSGDIQSFLGLHRGDSPLISDPQWPSHSPDVASKVQGQLGNVLGPGSDGGSKMADWLDNNPDRAQHLQNWAGEAQRLGYYGGQTWGDHDHPANNGELQKWLGTNGPTPGNGSKPGNGDFLQNHPNVDNKIGNYTNVPGSNFWNNHPNLQDKVHNFTNNGGDHKPQNWLNDHPQVQQKIQDHFDWKQPGSDWWSHNHPNLGPWYYQHDWNHHDWWYWWGGATWGRMTSWFPYWGWGAPVYYDYGPGGNVVYQDNSVYVNGQDVGTQAEYAQSASQLADTSGVDPSTSSDSQSNDSQSGDSANQEQFLPLGTFTISTSEQDPSTNRVIQLAVNHEGLISGTYYNTSTNKTYLVQGRVDKKTQRCAFTVGDNTSTVFETGIYNLTKNEVPVLVHFSTTRTEHYLFIRMNPPKDADKQDSDSGSDSKQEGLPF
ncbi:hypothetical protein [Bremerella cremea]|uniref:hypothetical protein n=1 Tax=Bremerella cremea TaxID=1031537 RepID=UPI0031EF40A4